MTRFADWLTGGGFAVFALALLATLELTFVGLLAWPAGTSTFADEFRQWCFGYDPATGLFEWSRAVAMLSPPWMLAAVLAVVWYEPLSTVSRAVVARASAAGFGVAGLACVGMLAFGTPAETGELPFPAEALRVALPAPDVQLTDQTGAAVDLADLRGEVVLLTAVYAHCVHTCPQIIGQTKRALAELTDEELSGLRVLGVTMDPERDSVEVLSRLAGVHELETPTWHLLTGESAEVEDVLDAMSVARQRDPGTGVIDHTNVFLLVDRQGRVAYRFSLGERQERWLTSALRVLLAEDVPQQSARL